MVTSTAQPDKVVRFTVPGEPRSKQRARVTARGSYTPPETKQAELVVATTYRRTGVTHFDFQLVVTIDFYNGNKRRRDIDNMAKLVLDALNGVAYADDHQVVELNLRKIHTTPEHARTVITLTEVIEWPCESKTV